MSVADVYASARGSQPAPMPKGRSSTSSFRTRHQLLLTRPGKFRSSFARVPVRSGLELAEMSYISDRVFGAAVARSAGRSFSGGPPTHVKVPGWLADSDAAAHRPLVLSFGGKRPVADPSRLPVCGAELPAGSHQPTRRALTPCPSSQGSRRRASCGQWWRGTRGYRWCSRW